MPEKQSQQLMEILRKRGKSKKTIDFEEETPQRRLRKSRERKRGEEGSRNRARTDFHRGGGRFNE